MILRKHEKNTQSGRNELCSRKGAGADWLIFELPKWKGAQKMHDDNSGVGVFWWMREGFMEERAHELALFKA